MEIDVEHFLKIKQRMNKILSENTGKTPEQVKLDSERDNWMTAQEAMMICTVRCARRKEASDCLALRIFCIRESGRRLGSGRIGIPPFSDSVTAL